MKSESGKSTVNSESCTTLPVRELFLGSGMDIQRFIYGLSFADSDMHYTEFELQKVAELDASWGEDGDPLVGTSIEETQKLRFIQGCYWDIPKASHAVRQYVEWRKDLKQTLVGAPNPRDPHTWLYFFGTDRSLRPVLIIDCKRLLEKKAEAHSETFVQDTIIEVMNYFVERLSTPGRIEQVIAIANLEGCSVWSTPVEEIEDCVRALTSRFRARLNKLFVINTPLIFYAFWKVIKVFIPERTQAKVAIFRSDYHDDLYRWIDNDQIDPLFRRSTPVLTG